MRNTASPSPAAAGRSEQPRPLERRPRPSGSRCERALDDRRRTARAPSSRFAGVIARVPGRLPRVEERLEHLVHELPLAPRIHHLFVVGLLFELEDVLREELERAAEVGLERADRPRARLARSDAAVESRRSVGERRRSAREGRRHVAARGLRRATALRRSARASRAARPRRRQAARAGTSSSCTDRVTIASSSSVNVESSIRRRRRRQQIEEARVGRAAPILLRRPAERLAAAPADRRCCGAAARAIRPRSGRRSSRRRSRRSAPPDRRASRTPSDRWHPRRRSARRSSAAIAAARSSIVHAGSWCARAPRRRSLSERPTSTRPGRAPRVGAMARRSTGGPQVTLETAGSVRSWADAGAARAA